MHFRPLDENSPLAQELAKARQVEELAYKLLRDNGLQDWKFVLSKTKRFVGMCYYGDKRIEFSEYFLPSDWPEIEDTILHEIAHALVGPGHGHNNVWKRKAVELGANPRHNSERAISNATPNYVIKCPNCGRQWKRYRMRQRNFGSYCPDCNVEVEIYKIRR